MNQLITKQLLLLLLTNKRKTWNWNSNYTLDNHNNQKEVSTKK